MILVAIAGTAPAASVEKVVYSFSGAPDGGRPLGGLVASSEGNLFGTTSQGGSSACGCGTVFELFPPVSPGGPWTEAVLYSFQGGSADGSTPAAALIFDQQGDLYGTTPHGGPNDTGTIFELSPPGTAGGKWTETVLWFFPPFGKKGSFPWGKLVMDGGGNLYGTAQFGGDTAGCNCGVVFELVKPRVPNTGWSERVLHQFGAASNDGQNPSAGLLLRGGALYGMTLKGGTPGSGIIFQLTPSPGLWAENVLYNFPEPILPYEFYPLTPALISDPAGNLYSTTLVGGGAIFELSPPATAGAAWQEVTLYSFTGRGDGAYPIGGLWRDKDGDLYGTGYEGNRRDSGSVFKLKPPASAGSLWTFVVLYDFGDYRTGEATNPTDGLTLLNGTFYGTTLGGGSADAGAVFSLLP
jgi:uncharacterized repeat protein (TIGR03803 family)